MSQWINQSEMKPFQRIGKRDKPVWQEEQCQRVRKRDKPGSEENLLYLS